MAICDITGEVNSAIERMGAREGLCNLFVSHTTAAVIVSENWDPDVTTDLLMHLERMVPREGGFKHSEGNSQAHILSVMLGTSINIPVSKGKLALGRWQGVMLAEFDGPRERKVRVSIVGAG
jgi:secondary thiamine-phosphate synthase enzyme